ncbi:hypothetical protein Micbo1qcDRAFT_45688 [Microdochium bolleyi]|uniref:Uncharacterized protein n=1 Tax=Microdochium bolleyi TaxID=196109 RepID=A0A136JBX9_9PEZI|nr:hypothetical protein Micbo1qcDRAFT_45688 [Microdochium bolleyi]
MEDTEAFLEGGSTLLPWLDIVSSELEALASLAISAYCSGLAVVVGLPLGATLLRALSTLPCIVFGASPESSGLVDLGMSSRASCLERSEGNTGYACSASSWHSSIRPRDMPGCQSLGTTCDYQKTWGFVRRIAMIRCFCRKALSWLSKHLTHVASGRGRRRLGGDSRHLARVVCGLCLRAQDGGGRWTGCASD